MQSFVSASWLLLLFLLLPSPFESFCYPKSIKYPKGTTSILASFNNKSGDDNNNSEDDSILKKQMNRREASSNLLLTQSTLAATMLPLSSSRAASTTNPGAAAAATGGGGGYPKVDTVKGLATLADKNKTPFPLASFGLQIYNDEKAYKLTTLALEVGYRNFFASVLARNQRGFSRAIFDSQIPRSELFICGSVISNRVSTYDDAYKLTKLGCQQNMAAFGDIGKLDYIDQIMLDYPAPNADAIRGQWAALEDMLQRDGLTKTLSVSNFSPDQLDCLLTSPDTQNRPLVNQLPFSVAYHYQSKSPLKILTENTIQRGVLVQAWAPLGGSLGGRFDSRIKGICAEIGKRYGNKTWAQVALRWIVQNGASFTTQSQNKRHFEENLQVFDDDFQLSPEDMSLLDSLA